MDEFKTPQKKNDLKQFIKNNYADLIGSGISGTLSLFSAVDPFVGFLAMPGAVGKSQCRELDAYVHEFLAMPGAVGKPNLPDAG